MKVYLIHFDRNLSHARHYIGKAHQLDKRMDHHMNGTGSRILQVCNERGIKYHIVRVWKLPDDKASQFERRLKNRKDSRNLCPVCNPEKWMNNERGYEDEKKR